MAHRMMCNMGWKGKGRGQFLFHDSANDFLTHKSAHDRTYDHAVHLAVPASPSSSPLPATTPSMASP